MTREEVSGRPREKVVVVVSGPPGSGKSTLAKRLAERLGLRYFSTGSLYRRIAVERGVGLEELDSLAERDPSIDLEIDSLARREAERGGVVIDTHAGGWLLRDLSTFSIYVTASLETRARRVAERDGKSLEEAMREIVSREESMRRRFSQLYGIDMRDTTVFDLVINTEKIDADLMTEISLLAIERILSRGPGPGGLSTGRT